MGSASLRDFLRDVLYSRASANKRVKQVRIDDATNITVDDLRRLISENLLGAIYLDGVLV